jgi:hypothetical protein
MEKKDTKVESLIRIAKRLSRREKEEALYNLREDWGAEGKLVKYPNWTWLVAVTGWSTEAIVLRIRCSECGDKFVLTSPDWGHIGSCPYCGMLYEVAAEDYEALDIA